MRNKSRLQLSLAAVFLLLPAAAFGQTSDEDVIYVTAARVPLPADDATASVTRLDEADIEARGAVFVADALRAVPGLAISRSGAPGSLTQVRARGAEANHVLVLIDGVEASNPFTGEADFAHFAFDDLAAIEVARGEQSALWGADAIGGVVRLSSRRPQGQGLAVRARAEAGSFGTYRTSGSLSATGERSWGMLSLSGYASDGIDVSGLGGEKDGYENHNIGASGGFAFNDAVRLEGAARWIDSASDYDTDIDWDGRLDNADLTARAETVYARLALLADHAARGVEWSHEAALQLTDDASENFSAGTRTSRSLGQRLQAHYQATANWQTGEIGHRLTGLVEHDRDRLKSFSAPGAGSNQSRVLERDALAFDYGLDRGPLNLTLSARHERNDMFEDATTWRAGAGWAFESVGGRLRASVGEGVKNPGIFELFGFFPDFFVGNPDLTPERSRGWELGWDQELLDGAASLSLVYFNSRLEDEIFTDFSVFPATARNNTGTSRREGVELAGRWTVSEAVSLFGSLTRLESEEGGAAEIRRPELTGSLTLDWQPPGQPFSGALTLDHTGEQTDTDFGTFQPVTLDAYTLVGGQLRWDVTDGVQVYVRGDNLLDEDYQDVFGYHTPGRGLYLGLRLTHG